MREKLFSKFDIQMTFYLYIYSLIFLCTNNIAYRMKKPISRYTFMFKKAIVHLHNYTVSPQFVEVIAIVSFGG